MLYFAYGSNMSRARLVARVPSAVFIGRYLLRCHRLEFHKVSPDGSAKCNAYFTGEQTDYVYGAVFKINPREKPNLDKAEGPGYQQHTVNIFDQAGFSQQAFTYKALQIDNNLKPYSWYLHHVRVGANELNLPADYIEKYITVDAIEDKDQHRDAAQRAIHLI